DQEDEVVVAPVRHAPRVRRRAVEQPSWTEQALLAADLDAGRAGMDEVELVLELVVVQEAFEVGLHDDGVDAEGGDAERTAHRAKAFALAELVDRREGVPGVVRHAATVSGRAQPTSQLTVWMRRRRDLSGGAAVHERSDQSAPMDDDRRAR